MRDRLAIVFVCLLVLSLPTMAVGTATPVDDPTPREVSATTQGTLDQSLELHHRPDDVGTFGATVTTSIPEAVTALDVRTPASATIESTDGFDIVGESTLRWDGETDEPTITLGVEANRRQQQGGHAPQLVGQVDDGLDFAETSEWGIVAVPQLALTWEYERGHSIDVERTAHVAGEGAAGETIAVFGPVEEYVSEAGEETHRLVVPEAADMAESPEAVLAALGDASEALTVGAPNDEFFVVAAPTGEVDWRAAGLQYGGDDAWVRADARLHVPTNVWLHEYVHSRQPFAGVGDGTTAATRWLVEGQADYYAATLSLEQGAIEYDAYRRFLERGQHYPYDVGVLAEPDTWADAETAYARGPLALGAIDREIRRATHGDRTLQGVFRRLNRADRPVEVAEFYAAVEAVGGPDARTAAEGYVGTDAIPATWSEREHRSTFGVEPTAFTFGFADKPVSVTGAYREAQLDDLSGIVPGETANVPVSIANVDDETGYYDAVLAVDGDVVDANTGTLAPGERTTETLSWTPDEPGTYDVGVGDERRIVTVEPAAEATVTQLSVSDRSVAAGEPVTATAVVTGHPDRPSMAAVRLTTPNGVVAEETVYLAPGETTTVEATFTLDRFGRNQVTAGDHDAFVGVGPVAGAIVEAEGALRSLSPTAMAGTTAVVLGVSGVLLARRRGLW